MGSLAALGPASSLLFQHSPLASVDPPPEDAPSDPFGSACDAQVDVSTFLLTSELFNALRSEPLQGLLSMSGLPRFLTLSFLSCCLQTMAQDQVIQLYDGPAPGSEHWKQTERENTTNLWQTRVVFNVVHPTLTVFRPDPAKANGTSIVICPGGGFFALSIDSEGFDVARWLNSKGVTCFVLKYRLVECTTDDPTREIMSRGPLDKVVAPTVKLALADANAAIRYVRQHATQYDLNPQRIGLIGFSAGGTVAISVALNYSPESRPDFVAPIYPAYSWAIKGTGVPADAPPAFILAASDDPLGLAPQSVSLYQDWIAAGKSAELHLYSQGGHGFGMRRQNLPSDRWIERLAEWLEVRGLLKK